MQRHEVLQPDDARELTKHFSRSHYTRQVVAGGKNVRGVEADAKPRWFAEGRNDVCEVLERMGKSRALAGGRMRGGVGGEFRRQSGLLAGAEVCAGMQNEKR